jgi:hypothetical protein
MALVFDTHKQHKSLVDAGLGEAQAEAITGMATAVLSVVAAKADLEATRTEFRARFDGIERRFDDFNKSLGRMNALMVGQLGATVVGIGIIVGAIFAVVAPHAR